MARGVDPLSTGPGKAVSRLCTLLAPHPRDKLTVARPCHIHSPSLVSIPDRSIQIISLANLTAHYLVRHLPKPALRTGDWTAQLSKEAIDYAAADVSSALLIYQRLTGILEKDEGPTGRNRLNDWIGDLWEEERDEKEKVERQRLEEEKAGED